VIYTYLNDKPFKSNGMIVMRLAIKILFSLIIIVVAGLIALPFFINPNDFKPQIESAVEKATGRQLTLEGDIGLSVFPWIALEMGPLSLSNAKGFTADHFAAVNKVEVRVKLLPLLEKKLEMDTVILDGLNLNLETNKQGVTNWADLAKSDEASEKEQDTSDTAGPALAAVTIGGVRLTQANISWVDASKGESYELKNVSLETEPLVMGEPTAVSMGFDIASAKPAAQARIELNTDVTVDLDKQQYALGNLNLFTQATSTELPFSHTELSFHADVTADMVKQLAKVDGLSLNLNASNTTQKVAAELSGNITSNLANQQTQIDTLTLKAQVEDPTLPGGKADLDLSTQISADLNKQTLQLSDLVLKLQDLVVNANVNAKQILADNPNFSGQVHVAPFNLRKLANSMDIELPDMADTSTLKQVEVSTAFSGNTQQVSANDLVLKFDQSTLKGNVGIKNFSQPALNFKLNLDNIDADRYMPPVSEEKPQAVATPATAAAGGSSQLPLEPLRAINAKGTIDIGKMKATNMVSENIHVTLNADKGLISLYPMRADLYQGHYSGNVSLDARGDKLKLAIDEKVSDVQAAPLLTDMTGDAPISGKANANIKLSGVGATVEAIKASLNGNGGFAFTDGAIQGINIAESIRKAKAALGGQKLADTNAPVQTDFSTLSGTFTVKQGVLDNQDLDMKSPLLRITGAGQADIAKETIDYRLKAAVVGTLSGQGGAELAELKGLTIPVKITGTFSQPKPTVDLASILQDKAKQELKTKAEEKLKEKLGDKLGNIVGGSVGSQTTTEDTTTNEEAEPAATPEKQLEDALKDKLKGFF
jgi:AsmA protein